ncbi:hypothetical protein QA639_13695 [Bradyrhizobium pachyrhizi]|uniref:hypothetical protein n=1 Tax=Bradyrhizobium pachyrhizi TaxID=280333 RepID=UPI0024B21C17|nr:hypothetical protein [Bradyrhizobium pachyrhizi]WFU58473.1 hypothetical protein QA639_13695 [Bradyrhizobium pachyrhizi]
MPSGEEDDIPERADPLLFFFAPAAARAFLVFATSDPSLCRDYDRPVTCVSGRLGACRPPPWKRKRHRFPASRPNPPEMAAGLDREERFPLLKSMACLLAGAGGIEPPNGGIKISLIIQRFQGAFGKSITNALQ